MTSAIDLTVVPHDGWTTDLLDHLPEDGVRREIIDGVLLVSPSPTDFHQDVVYLLAGELRRSCPGQLKVTQGVEVRISRKRSFVPDVLAVTKVPGRGPTRKFEADDVALAVEIVSPSSLAIDRVLKPSVYAEAGIPFYWRVELTPAPLTVTTYALNDGVYRCTGEHSGRLLTDGPWAIDLDLTALEPG